MEGSNQPPKKGSWGKRLLIIFGVLAVLLVAAYFVMTSSAFFKAVILPRAGAALNAKIEVKSASISPFSRVALEGLRVQTTGTEPLLTAEHLELRYSLMDIIGGNINVSEVTVVTPVVQIIQEADGSSNLDPILAGDKTAEDESESKPGEPLKLNIRNVSLKNGTVRQITKQADGGSARTELQNLDFTLDQLGNEKSGKLQLSADLTMEQKLADAPADLLKGTMGGSYQIALDRELLPQTVEGSTQLRVSQGGGAYAELQGMDVTLSADMTPTEIKQVALRFAKGGEPLGQVRLYGPLDLNKMEGRLNLEVLSLDKNVLNLVGAGHNWDFQNSTINSTNQVQISQEGSFIAANGNLAGREISVQQETLTTPAVDLNLEYQATVNLNDKTAVLQKLNLSGQQEGKDLVKTYLDRQMTLSWGTSVQGFREASLQLVLTNFNIADWRAVLGTNLHSGVVGAQVGIVSQQDGKLLKTDVNAFIQNLNAQFGSNVVRNADIRFQTAGTVENLNLVNLTNYSLTLAQDNKRVLQGNGMVRLNLENNDTTAQLAGEGNLGGLLALAAMPDASASGGMLKVNAKYTEAGGKKEVVGTVGVEQFTGKFQEYTFENFQTALEYNVGMENEVVDIRRFAATFAQGFEPGGSVEVTGKYNMNTEAGQVAFKTVGLNQNAIRPVLAPALGENQLVSIALDAGGNAAFDPEGESSIKADVKVSNLVVQDKAGTMPGTPLSLQFAMDGGMRAEVLELRQFALQMSPTDRAKNELLVQAKLDLAKTNAGPSTLSIQSESFDVTPYYNMFSSGDPAEEVEAEGTPGTATSAGTTNVVATEPAAMELPVRNLTANLKIGRFYLREVAITNWNGQMTIQSNVISMKPFEMVLNGGNVSVSGQVNVGTPGYQYDIGLGAEGVPLAPLANTFGDTNEPGQVKGLLFARANISGSGTTGANLKKYLAGNASLNLTNIDLRVVSPKWRKVLVPISIALKAPEIAETPINWMAGDLVITNGVVDFQTFSIESEAFFAQSSGTIQLADELGNSALHFPLEMSLRRSLARKSGLLPAKTPEEAKYAKIGAIVTVEGTIDDPQPNINKVAIAGMILKSAGGLGLGDEKTEGILGEVGELLQGQGQGGTNAGGGNLIQGLGSILGGKSGETNTTGKSTNSEPAGGNLLRGLGGLLGGTSQPQTTNSPAGTNETTNAPAPGLLDLFRKPDKKE